MLGSLSEICGFHESRFNQLTLFAFFPCFCFAAFFSSVMAEEMQQNTSTKEVIWVAPVATDKLPLTKSHKAIPWINSSIYGHVVHQVFIYLNAWISASTQHNLLPCVGNDEQWTITVALHYEHRSGESDSSLSSLCTKLGADCASVGSAAMLAWPDAADLFPHQWMVQAESQWVVWPTFQLSKCCALYIT